MWILTDYGEMAINMDMATHVFYEEPENKTYLGDPYGDCHVICYGNRVGEIIQNIISGTKIMEVN